MPKTPVRRSWLLCICLLAASSFFTVFVAPGTSHRASKLPRAVLAIDDLQVGDKHAGTVLKVMPYGAFVGFGCEKEGMVHISQLMDGFVDDVHTVVSEGQEVDVWVKQVEGTRISLTMVESKLRPLQSEPRPDVTPFEPLVGSDPIPGKVVAVLKFGALVEIENDGVTARGLVHVSEMGEGFVEDPNSIVSEGDEVEVRVIAVDTHAQKISMSMKPEGAEEEAEPEE